MDAMRHSENFWNSRCAVGVVVPVFSRPVLLKECLRRLFSSNLGNGTCIIIVNDASQIPEVDTIVNDSVRSLVLPWLYLKKQENKGIADSLICGWDILQKLGVSIFCSLDSDMLVSPDWLQRMNALMASFSANTGNSPQMAVFTGFCESLIGHHKVIKDSRRGWVEKSSIGGCHVMFHSSFWTAELKEHLNVKGGRGWDWRLVEWCNKYGVKMVCIKPSCVQHVGAQGMNSKEGTATDYALDFWESQGDFVFLPALDCVVSKMGSTIEDKSITDLMAICASKPTASAFNSNGQMFSSISLEGLRLRSMINQHSGLYVKQSAWTKFISQSSNSKKTLPSIIRPVMSDNKVTVTHQTWKSANTLTPAMVEIRKTLLNVYPSATHFLWDDQQIDTFMATHYSGYYTRFFNKLPTPIMKIDVARYAWMHHFGGMYCDLDLVIKEDVAALFNPSAKVVFVEREWTYPVRADIVTSVHNCWICAPEKGHPIWIDLLEGIAKLFEGGERNVWNLTGPNAISFIITRDNLLEKYRGDIDVLPGSVIYQRGSSKHDGTSSVLTHECHNSWNGKAEKLQEKKTMEKTLTAKTNVSAQTNFVVSASSNDIEATFSRIYQKKGWGVEGDGSGSGSSLHNTVGTRRVLATLVDTYGWKSILDAPCGSMVWQFELLRTYTTRRLQFVGVDIVPDVIRKNTDKLGQIQKDIQHDVSFQVCDIVHSRLPKNIPPFDVIICRDSLQHLPLEDIKVALKNIASSGASFALLGSYPKRNKENVNIKVGEYFSIDLLKPPFSLPQPLEIVDEGLGDKFFYLYRISDLQKSLFPLELPPVYVILLQRDSDRCEHVNKVLLPSLKNFDNKVTVLDAVDGKTPRLDQLLAENNIVVPSGTRLSRAQQACFLSHYEIWKRVVDQKLECALIFEDDAVIVDSNKFSNQLISAVDQVREYDADWLFLYTYVFKDHRKTQAVKDADPMKKELVMNAFFCYGTASYVISLKGAKVFLDKFRHFTKPVDTRISDLIVSESINSHCYACKEVIVECAGQAASTYRGEKLRSNIWV